MVQFDLWIAYHGSVFVVEWFFSQEGYSQPYEHFMNMPIVQQRKFLLLIKRIGDFGKINDITKFRNEADKIYAFKPQPDRFLSFFTIGKKIIITNAFVNKSDKLPSSEKDIAIRCMDNYLFRIQEDTYYAKYV